MTGLETRGFKMLLDTFENLKLLRTLLPQIPIVLNFINLVEDIMAKRDITPAQAEEVGKILYGWVLFTPGTLKSTATADEIEAWIVNFELLVNTGINQYKLSQNLFVA
jgi:hypothetical protein